MRHRAPGIDLGDSLECLPCLWIGHVMEKSNPSIELRLSLFRAGDWKINRAQRMIAMLLDLSFDFPRRDSDKTKRESDFKTQEVPTK
jgi:hypothetical protein